MTDTVYNNMMKFQFFCNGICKQKNIDKLVPNGMSYSDWTAQKETILKEEIESTSRFLHQEATKRIESLPAVDKDELSERFLDIITQSVTGYADKIHYHYL